MTIQQVLFIALSLVILGSAVFVVSSRNLFRSALLLMVSFFGVAGFYVLLEAGFFAVAQVLVYIGAISILIIFGVMLTRGMQGMIPRNSQAVAAAIVCAIVFGAIVLVLGPLRTTIDAARWPIVSLIFRNATPREVGNIEWPFANLPVPETYIADLGRALVDINQFALPFELASVLIVLVMIGSIWVARERRPSDVIAERAEIAAEEAAERAETERVLQPQRPQRQPLPEGAVTASGSTEH